MIVTVADPTVNIQKLLFKVCSLLDRGLNILVKNPKLLFVRVINKIFNSNKINPNEKRDNSNSWLAEFHTQYGIDDISLKKIIISNGNYILWHKRFTGGYTPFFQFLYRRLRLNTSFALIISNTSYPNININV